MVVPLLTSPLKATLALGVSPCLREAIEFYDVVCEGENHTQATRRTNKDRLTWFLRFLQDNGCTLEMSQITAIHLIAYINHQTRKELSPHSVKSYRASLVRFFKWAKEWNLVEEDPSQNVPRVKAPKVRKGIMRAEHFRALLDLCPQNTFLGARRQALIWIFASTGARRREIGELTLEDIDIRKGTIRILHGKGQKERTVPLIKEARVALLRYLAHRKDHEPELWVTMRGKPFDYASMGKDLKRLKVAAGLTSKEFRDGCHAFRRAFATQSVKQRMTRQYILAVAGWETGQMLDHYVDELRQEEEEAVSEFRLGDPDRGIARFVPFQ